MYPLYCIPTMLYTHYTIYPLYCIPIVLYTHYTLTELYTHCIVHHLSSIPSVLYTHCSVHQLSTIPIFFIVTQCIVNSMYFMNGIILVSTGIYSGTKCLISVTAQTFSCIELLQKSSEHRPSCP